jgi:hypothetical protein
MIDLKNTYIVNDSMEKFNAYIKMGLSQGVKSIKDSKCEYLKNKSIILIKRWSNDGDYQFEHSVTESVAYGKQITLADLKPKRTKVEYVKVESSEAVHWFAEFEGDLYQYPSEDAKAITLQQYIDDLASGEDQLYRKVETELTWKDEAKELLLPALRQYKHNNGDGFVCGYDCEEVGSIVSKLLASMTDKPE